MKYGQAIAAAAAQVDISPASADTLRYMNDRAFDLVVSRDVLNAIYYGPDGIKGTADDTDAILALGNNFAAAPAKAGFPSVTVPGGFILADPANDPPIQGPFPQTVTFSGPAFSEPRLIGLGYAFEQATHYRVPPSSTPPLASDSVGRP
jgi:amidase